MKETFTLLLSFLVLGALFYFFSMPLVDWCVTSKKELAKVLFLTILILSTVFVLERIFTGFS